LNDRSYVVRTGGSDPMSLIPAIRQRLADMSGLVPMIAPRTMDAVLQRSMSRTTFLTALLGTAAMMALILSAVGIYGVISYVVSQRRSEIGIRMALGASVQQVVSMVLMQSVRLAVVGIAVGLVGAYAVSRALQSLLFGVRGADPVVLVVVVALLFATTIAASLIPSRRAALVDPSEAMRAG
jgi:putative ABC transport system permease protein